MQRHELRFWDGSQWTARVSDAGREGLDPLIAAPTPRTGVAPMWKPERPDPGFWHFLRFLAILVLMLLLVYVVVGVVWMAFALSATGRRKRDLLMLLIPFWSTVVLVQTVWRYTARNVYWPVRPDTVSKSLFSA